MKGTLTRSWKMVALVTLVTFLPRAVTPALAVSPVKMKNFGGTIDYADDGPSPFELDGVASHLGRFTARGEVTLVPGDEEGTFVGQGVVVFEAANGDLLVGTTTWDVDGDQVGRMHFAWQDAVQFSDGTVVANTGRFVDDRPPGLVVIAIIAILIGLLIPAVQK
ncbi:MAG: hypothetical protein DCC68_21615 [Planctomycetota bacterium]|nr:MAG: hypothetical protein DCC68_21615 [Planctomycetota bacterium]